MIQCEAVVGARTDLATKASKVSRVSAFSTMESLSGIGCTAIHALTGASNPSTKSPPAPVELDTELDDEADAASGCAASGKNSWATARITPSGSMRAPHMYLQSNPSAKSKARNGLRRQSLSLPTQYGMSRGCMEPSSRRRH